MGPGGFYVQNDEMFDGVFPGHKTHFPAFEDRTLGNYFHAHDILEHHLMYRYAALKGSDTLGIFLGNQTAASLAVGYCSFEILVSWEAVYVGGEPMHTEINIRNQRFDR